MEKRRTEYENTLIKYEKNLIGTMMNDNEALQECISCLDEIDFIVSDHKIIFSIIKVLYSAGSNINYGLVQEKISKFDPESKKDDLQFALDEIEVSYLDMGIDITDIIEIIKNASIKRQLDDFCSKVIETKIDFNEYNDQIAGFEKKFLDIIQSKKTTSLEDISKPLASYEKRLWKLNSNNSDDLTGITSGYAGIDKMTNGFQDGDLIILAARPGVGKTALSLNFLTNAAKSILISNKKNECVVFFSLEMGSEQICQRLVSNESRVEAARLRDGRWKSYQKEDILRALTVLSDLPIKIDDNSNVSILDIQTKIKQLISADERPRLVIVDYLQLLSAQKTKGMQQNRQQEVAHISRTLKIMAKTLSVPIIAIAQLSRKIEERGKKADGSKSKPVLSDLRESGSIEQDADLVCFLNYKDESEETVDEDRTTVEFIIEKHRNGPTGSTDLNFLKKFSQYANPGEEE